MGEKHLMITMHNYLLQNLKQTVMISLSIDNGNPFQYNNWNWFHQESQLHLLKDDYSIGHIIHTGSVTQNEDGSINHISVHNPKTSVMNFYFGGVK